MPSDQRTIAACPYCLCAIQPGATEPKDLPYACPGCQYRYHAGCYQELGGCAIDGCSRMVEVKKAVIPVTHWGATTKTCPMCAESIPVESLECPICRAVFTEARPLSREDFLPKFEDPLLAEIRSRSKWLLVFSLIGCTSPFALIFGGLWYRNNEAEIARAGSSTRALVLISLLICVLYVVMLGVGALAFSLKHDPS
jgi:hypothetical protein